MPEEPPKQPENPFQQYAHDAANRPIINFGSQRDLAEQQEVMRETAPYMTLGIQMVLTIGIFFGVGFWLDKHFHTSPLWTALLTGIGAVASLTYFILTVLRLSKKTETKRR